MEHAGALSGDRANGLPGLAYVAEGLARCLPRGAPLPRLATQRCKNTSIPYAVEGPDGPLYADFRALRHAFIALLDRGGATLKEAVQLARHSDPKLTMAVYGCAQFTTWPVRLGDCRHCCRGPMAPGPLGTMTAP